MPRTTMTVLALLLAAGLVAADEPTAPASAAPAALRTLNTGGSVPTDEVTIPQRINYQGLLTDRETGRPLEGPVELTFKLYDGLIEYWSEGPARVELIEGTFGVELGASVPLFRIPGPGVCSLEVIADGVPMTPKVPFVSVPYAYYAQEAATAGPDDDWTRTGPVDSVLYTASYVGVARGGADNMLHGSGRHTHVNFGSDCTTGTSGESYEYCTVGGGSQNVASHSFGTVSGGLENTASSYGATVGGGWGSTASDFYATVGGGLSNTASGTAATVGGGFSNNASAGSATVGGGGNNTASDDLATVGGGSFNTASGNLATVGGGWHNTASGDRATVGGGQSDTAKAVCGGVLSGYSNLAGDDPLDSCATVCGGYDCSATGRFALVGGGQWNSASGLGATVGGGRANSASRDYATISGGYNSAARGVYSALGGGFGNTSGIEATGYTAVGGGQWNNAVGYYSTVPGGRYNEAGGYGSFAAGYMAHANNDGSFAWADYGSTIFNVSVNNRFGARASGGVYFYTNSGLTSGSYLAAGGSSWNSVSDSLTKENFEPVDRKALLERLARMRLREYNLRSQEDDVRHIGPVAQDFHAAFGYGESNTAINMEDADGVALAAIQALYQELQDRDARIERLEARLAELEAR